MDKEALVKEFVREGCMVEPGVVDSLRSSDLKLFRRIDSRPERLDEEALEQLRGEKDVFVDESGGFRTKVEVEKQFEGNMEEKDVDEFVQYYNDRFFRMKEMLENRVELSNAASIDRLSDRDEREDVAIIGLVVDKYKTSSGRWIVYLEDPTGDTKVLVDEEEGEWIVEDEILGIAGMTGDDIVFANDIVRPDVPLSRDVASTEDEVYAAFMSDMHFGSEDTLDEEIHAFAEWLRSDEGVAGKIGYLFVNGDAVEGVGEYPGQKEELAVEDVYEQYGLFEEFVERVPDHVQIIVAPGNHDFVRLAEPQPRLPREMVPNIYDRPNVHFVSNPATVKVHGFDGRGIRVLLYHGYSFDSHVDAVPELRDRGYEEPHHCMVDLLKRRHLAPTFGSNLLSPEDRDFLVIEEAPDIFVMGHTHAFDVANYKGINLISSGTMQSRTDFQKRVGHKPDPGMIAMVNLKTRDTVVKEFTSGDAGE